MSKLKIANEELPEQELHQRHLNLVYALLVRSIMDIADKNPNVRRDARKWFGHEGHEPWSFHWACRVLGYDPKDLRESLDDMPKTWTYWFRSAPRKPAKVTRARKRKVH